jgi:chaperone required for assembly of F1-ATPase
MSRRSKRTYQTVSVVLSGDRFAVLLDGKPARVGVAALELPARPLADAVAEEWRAQKDRLDSAHMRLTGLAVSALSRIASERGDVVEHVLGFGRSELLCYRAIEPPDLVALQKTHWEPLLQWAYSRHGIRLVADAGVSFIEQPVDALLRMQEIVSARDDFELAALDAAATLASSFVVAFALVERQIVAEEAFRSSYLDELYQAEKWGSDAEAQFRRGQILAELKAVEHFVSLLK